MVSHWWKNPNNINNLLNAAEVLDGQYPDAQIVAVGQSAAWIVYALGELRSLKGRSADTQILAFTGHFMAEETRNHRLGERSEYSVDSKLYPHKSAFQSYFNYLADEHMSPAQVSQRYQKSGQKTVFVDMVVSGEGFASFMHTWFMALSKAPASARHGFVWEALAFHIYDWREQSPTHFAIEMEHEDTLIVPLMRAEGDGIDVTLSISNGQGESDVTAESERLAPAFDISAEGSGVLKYADNEERVKAIIAIIQQAAIDRLAAQAPAATCTNQYPVTVFARQNISARRP